MGMDALIETIAEQLGPKWTQLYSHLLLGPRDRYKFETNHRGEPERVSQKNCARDSMRLWVRNQGEGLEEREAMRGLLLALQKTRGFAELAGELAHRNGIVLAPPRAPEAQPVMGRSLPTPPSLAPTVVPPSCSPSLADVARHRESQAHHPQHADPVPPTPPQQQVHDHTVMSRGHPVLGMAPLPQPHPAMVPPPLSQPHPSMPPAMPPMPQPHPSMPPQSQPHPSMPPQYQPHPAMPPQYQPHPAMPPLPQPHPSGPQSYSPPHTELPPRTPQSSLQQTAHRSDAPRNYPGAALVHPSLPQPQTVGARPLAPESLSAPVVPFASPHSSRDRDRHLQLPSSQPYQPPPHRPQTAPHQLVQRYPDEWHSHGPGGDLHSGPLPDPVGTHSDPGEQFSQLAARYTAPTFTPERPMPEAVHRPHGGPTPSPPNPPTYGRSSVSSTGGSHRSVPEGSALLYSSGSEPPGGYHDEEEQGMSSGGGPRSKVMAGRLRDPLHSKPHSQPVNHDIYLQPDAEELHCPIDLTRTRHKFALLDLAQRLAPDKWFAIGTQLELSQPALQTIEGEQQPEERYYKVLMQWVRERSAEATFAALRGALESHEQFAAVSVMARRLQTTGMTLN